MNALPLALALLAPVGEDSVEAAKRVLTPLNPLVGEWRGVGQVRRGSRDGAWRESAAWVWDFSDPARPGVRLEVEGGDEIRRLLVRSAPGGGFRATLAPAQGEPQTLTAAELGETIRFLPTVRGRLTASPSNGSATSGSPC